MKNSKMCDLGRVRAIAFYLPQFHSIPENDLWWGKGFTDWVNVAKAKPLFRGHYQPHLPKDIGFYDLRSPEVRSTQAELARSHGIYGFCYYHYWFHGKRLLEQPLEDVLKLQKPDFPFCLCWANENWTQVWDGKENQVLMTQEYSGADDIEHINYLCDIFRDKRYIRINGKPLFLVYRAEMLPDVKQTVAVWRKIARKKSVGELYLVRVDNNFCDNLDDPQQLGFDRAVEFQPHKSALPPQGLTDLGISFLRGMFRRGKRSFMCVDYGKFVRHADCIPEPNYLRFPCVSPGFDNTPRRTQEAFILNNSSPVKYRRWLGSAVRKSKERFTGDERILFINAWNEWGEGNHLEPDRRWGRAYLEVTKDVLQT